MTRKLINILQMAERQKTSVFLQVADNIKEISKTDIKRIGLDSVCMYKKIDGLIIIDYMKIKKIDFDIFTKCNYLYIKINGVLLWAFWIDKKEIKAETSDILTCEAEAMAEALTILYLDNDKRIKNTFLNNSIIKNIEYNKINYKRLKKAIFRALKGIQ